MRFEKDEIEIVSTPDVLVCGAGCAGIGAAIAAAEMGMSVLVVEKAGFAGGFITAVMGPGLDGMWDIVTGETVVGGIAQDVLADVCDVPREEHGGRFTCGGDITKESGVDRGKPAQANTEMTPVEMNMEAFKHYADQRFRGCGADVLFHTFVCGVVADGPVIESVILANKSGLTAVRPRFIVDCTGDADIAAWSGNQISTQAAFQPMTLHFRLGNVDLTETLVANCHTALNEAYAEGLIDSFGGPWMLRLGPRDVAINATRLHLKRTDPREWTRAEMDGREAAWRIFQLWRERVPECADAYYITSGPEAGARETRQIVGKYTLTGDDIVSRRRFQDVIVQGAWYFDQHPVGDVGFHPHGVVRAYQIPFGTIVPSLSENLLVAGRCHSATPEALASSRVTATSLGMGEAAGAAAALAVRAKVSAAAVNTSALRRALLDRGAILELSE